MVSLNMSDKNQQDQYSYMAQGNSEVFSNIDESTLENSIRQK